MQVCQVEGTAEVGARRLLSEHKVGQCPQLLLGRRPCLETQGDALSKGLHCLRAPLMARGETLVSAGPI